MGGQSLNRELLEIWHLDQQTPTGSAFIQQRSKLSKDALPFLFEELNEMFPGRRDISILFLSLPINSNVSTSFAGVLKLLSGISNIPLACLLFIQKKRSSSLKRYSPA